MTGTIDCPRGLLRRAGALLCLAAVAACQPTASSSVSPGAIPPGAPGGTAEMQAQVELALRLGIGRGVAKDLPASAALLEGAAKAGDVGAQITLADYYLTGAGVERNPQMAVEWLQKAARSSAPAQA